MEDLRDIGNKTIESIKRRKPSDVGDLVIAIGEIVLELRKNEEDQTRRNKLSHLYSLLDALIHGQEYTLLEDEEDEEEDIIPLSGQFIMPNILPQAPGNPPPGLPIQPIPPATLKWTKMSPAEQARFEAEMTKVEGRVYPSMVINMDTGELTYRVTPNDDIPKDDNEQ